MFNHRRSWVPVVLVAAVVAYVMVHVMKDFRETKAKMAERHEQIR